MFSGVIYVSFSINKADEMREREKKRRERMVRKKQGEGREKNLYIVIKNIANNFISIIKNKTIVELIVCSFIFSLVSRTRIINKRETIVFLCVFF